ncbi:MAG TPA: acyltransferase family protein, partial [Candidatus Binatus sp.]|nr:acyltransferase family protein [Candidatus Binatus sp.]
MLRGVAALSVVVYASFNYLNYINFVSLQTDPLGKALWFQVLYAIVAQGYLGVPLFFVISGFCIHLPWARQVARSGEATVNFVKFWKRRWVRLYPTYFVVLCISMALVVFAYVFARNMSIIQNYPQPGWKWLIIDFFAHAFMLHGLHPALDKAGGNAPFWSLSREEYLYLMYFALLACRRAFGMFAGLGMVLATSFVTPLLMLPFVPTGSSWWM